MPQTLKKKDLVERLKTVGVRVDLRNNYRYTESLTEIADGIKLIEQHERRSGLKVAILGEIWRSLGVFETQYLAYELKRAIELQGTERHGKIITVQYLEDRRAWLLSPAYARETAV